MDDITTLAQDNTGAQILLDATQQFEAWSNTKLNLSKTVVVCIDGGSGEVDPPQLTYKQRPVKVFQDTESCRHLGYWATRHPMATWQLPNNVCSRKRERCQGFLCIIR
jgi:hypothetical protein